MQTDDWTPEPVALLALVVAVTVACFQVVTWFLHYRIRVKVLIYPIEGGLTVEVQNYSHDWTVIVEGLWIRYGPSHRAPRGLLRHTPHGGISVHLANPTHSGRQDQDETMEEAQPVVRSDDRGSPRRRPVGFVTPKTPNQRTAETYNGLGGPAMSETLENEAGTWYYFNFRPERRRHPRYTYGREKTWYWCSSTSSSGENSRSMSARSSAVMLSESNRLNVRWICGGSVSSLTIVEVSTSDPNGDAAMRSRNVGSVSSVPNTSSFRSSARARTSRASSPSGSPAATRDGYPPVDAGTTLV